MPEKEKKVKMISERTNKKEKGKTNAWFEINYKKSHTDCENSIIGCYVSI